MEYLKCNFSYKTNRNERWVRMDDIEINSSNIHNLSSII